MGQAFRVLMLLAMSWIAGACASLGDRPLAGRDFLVTAQDRPAVREISLTFRSLTDEALCLRRNQWPDEEGGLELHPDNFAIVIGEISYGLTSIAFYCLDDCLVRVEPGTTMTASLAYADTQIPRAEYDQPKTIHIELHPLPCNQVESGQ